MTMYGRLIIAFSIFVAVAGISSVAAWGTFRYLEHKQGTYISTLFGNNIDQSFQYTAYITVTSFDPASRELIINLYSNALNEVIPSKVGLAEDIVIERSDVIVQNGLLVGSTAIRRGTVEDLVPGTRGFATIRRRDDGAAIAHHILIGNPVPHP